MKIEREDPRNYHGSPGAQQADRLFNLLQRRVRILENTGVGAWKWLVRVGSDAQHVRVEICVRVPNSDGDLGEIAQIRFFYTPPAYMLHDNSDNNDNSLIAWFFDCCHDVVFHELAEAFRVDGELYSDPHAEG